MHPDLKGDLDPKDRFRWEKAVIAFTMLKDKIANMPILKHFDFRSNTGNCGVF